MDVIPLINSTTDSPSTSLGFFLSNEIIYFKDSKYVSPFLSWTCRDLSNLSEGRDSWIEGIVTMARQKLFAARALLL